MDAGQPVLKKSYAVNASVWFHAHFYQSVVSPIGSQFPSWPSPREIQETLAREETIAAIIKHRQEDPFQVEPLLSDLSLKDSALPALFKRMILLYRRQLATNTERFAGKTFHISLGQTIEEELHAFDNVVSAECIVRIQDERLPRLKDYLPIQYIQPNAQIAFLPRQFDEKFHTLQTPQLFLPDMAYFRAQCEDRETPLAVAFVDIDDFKSLNTRHTESKVDRNLLPRFMQAMEEHVFHHGYAYRQGGEEYLILLPSLSTDLAIRFLDELRRKLAQLSYPDISERTTVSIGLCIAGADCPLTDMELRDRANRAERFAKKNGKNCIATYRGQRFVDDELHVAKLVAPVIGE